MLTSTFTSSRRIDLIRAPCRLLQLRLALDPQCIVQNKSRIKVSGFSFWSSDSRLYITWTPNGSAIHPVPVPSCLSAVPVGL